MLLHQTHRGQELSDALQSVIFALDGDQHRIGGGQSVQSQQAQRWRAVHEDVFELLPDPVQSQAQNPLAVFQRHQLDFRPHQLDVGRQNLQELQLRVLHRLLGVEVVDDHLVDGLVALIGPEAHAGCGIGLRINIQQERALFGGGQKTGQVHGRRGLPDAALLIGNGDDARHKE
jgi:hypothetical protein